MSDPFCPHCRQVIVPRYIRDHHVPLCAELAALKESLAAERAKVAEMKVSERPNAEAIFDLGFDTGLGKRDDNDQRCQKLIEQRDSERAKREEAEQKLTQCLCWEAEHCPVHGVALAEKEVEICALKDKLREAAPLIVRLRQGDVELEGYKARAEAAERELAAVTKERDEAMEAGRNFADRMRDARLELSNRKEEDRDWDRLVQEHGQFKAQLAALSERLAVAEAESSTAREEAAFEYAKKMEYRDEIAALSEDNARLREAFHLENEKVDKSRDFILNLKCACTGEGIGTSGECDRCRALNYLSTFGWDFNTLSTPAPKMSDALKAMFDEGPLLPAPLAEKKPYLPCCAFQLPGSNVSGHAWDCVNAPKRDEPKPSEGA